MIDEMLACAGDGTPVTLCLPGMVITGNIQSAETHAVAQGIHMHEGKAPDEWDAVRKNRITEAVHAFDREDLIYLGDVVIFAGGTRVSIATLRVRGSDVMAFQFGRSS